MKSHNSLNRTINTNALSSVVTARITKPVKTHGKWELEVLAAGLLRLQLLPATLAPAAAGRSRASPTQQIRAGSFCVESCVFAVKSSVTQRANSQTPLSKVNRLTFTGLLNSAHKLERGKIKRSKGRCTDEMKIRAKADKFKLLISVEFTIVFVSGQKFDFNPNFNYSVARLRSTGTV